MVSEDQDTKIRRATLDAINKGNVEALDEVINPSFVLHRPPGPDCRSLDAYKQMILGLRKAFSNIEFTVEDYIRSGDMHASRYTMRGTHTGPIPAAPIPPTGKTVTINGMVMARWANDKVVEEWEYVDMLGLMQQLGVLPAMGKPGG
jgi:predicted ester cyclase